MISPFKLIKLPQCTGSTLNDVDGTLCGLTMKM